MGDAVKKVFEMIKDNDVAFVDFRFTDPRENGNIRLKQSIR